MRHQDYNRRQSIESVLFIVVFFMFLFVLADQQKQDPEVRFTGSAGLVLSNEPGHINATIPGSIPVVTKVFDSSIQDKMFCSFSIRDKISEYNRRTATILSEARKERDAFLPALTLRLNNTIHPVRSREVPVLS